MRIRYRDNCKGSGISTESMQGNLCEVQNKLSAEATTSLSASLLLNISHPNTPSLFTLPACSEETASGQQDLYSREFDGYLLY